MSNKSIARIPTSFAGSIKYLGDTPTSVTLLFAMIKAGCVNPEVALLMTTNLRTIHNSILPFFDKRFSDQKLQYILSFGETESVAVLKIEPKQEPHDFLLTATVEFQLNAEGYIEHIAKYVCEVKVKLS